MTKDELLEILKDSKEHDAEISHEDADEALLKYINDPEITEAFMAMTRWYS